jgi:hypothetical protein
MGISDDRQSISPYIPAEVTTDRNRSCRRRVDATAPVSAPSATMRVQQTVAAGTGVVHVVREGGQQHRQAHGEHCHEARPSAMASRWWAC